MPLAVEAYEYLLHQIFSLMRTEAHANEARRKRSTQGSRNFFEHALICDGFAAPLGAHGLCPALLALFHGYGLSTGSSSSTSSSTSAYSYCSSTSSSSRAPRRKRRKPRPAQQREPEEIQ